MEDINGDALSFSDLHHEDNKRNVLPEGGAREADMLMTLQKTCIGSIIVK